MARGVDEATGPDIAAARLSPEAYRANFGDIHPPLAREAEAIEFLKRHRTARSQLDASAGQDIEHGGAFRHSQGVIEILGQQRDSVSDANARRALAERTKQDFRGRAMRPLREQVMLHRPHVAPSELVSEHDLIETSP